MTKKAKNNRTAERLYAARVIVDKCEDGGAVVYAYSGPTEYEGRLLYRRAFDHEVDARKVASTLFDKSFVASDASEIPF